MTSVLSSATTVEGNDMAVLEMERNLRRKAYARVPILLTASFFDDSDMKGTYYLLIIYDQATQLPVLSCRFYFTTELIAKSLKGDAAQEQNLVLNGKQFSLQTYTAGSICLADRLSGNTTSAYYRLHRKEIFELFYKSLVKAIAPASLLLMVREERQVERYKNLGFLELGRVEHKGKLHSVIFHSLQNV